MIIPPNVERPWHEISLDLLSALKNSGLKPSTIAINTGVNYQAVRRMLAGKLENRTTNAVKLCHYFQIPLCKSDNIEPIAEIDILNSIRDVWDGTQAHANLIVRLIRATKSHS